VTPDAFKRTCLGLPGTHLVVQWGGSDVYKVGPKVFAICARFRPLEADSYVFKVSDMAYELLIEHGLARPAPYLHRARWVALAQPDALADEDLAAYLRQAHAIVAAKLTRAQRRELGVSSQ
jgi:predicted DNA-binding protein (MmcQ/YjbR family)